MKEGRRAVQMGDIRCVRPIAGCKKEHPKHNENALKELSKAKTTGNKVY
jgi:hypothetical protein